MSNFSCLTLREPEKCSRKNIDMKKKNQVYVFKTTRTRHIHILQSDPTNAIDCSCIFSLLLRMPVRELLENFFLGEKK